MDKKIIIDVRLLSKGGSSGIEEYTTNIIDNILAALTPEFYKLFYNGVTKVPLPERWVQNKRIEIIAPNFPNKLLDLSSRILSLPKVENFTGSADLVFSPHFNLLNTGLPHVVTFHDLSFIHHPDFFSRRQRIWHWFQNYKFTAKNAAHCIAVSEFTKNDLIKFLGIPEEKVSVVYSGIHQSFKPLDKNSDEFRKFKEKYNLYRPFILYLGTLEPRKNLPALIRAFDKLSGDERFKDFELILAGKVGWLPAEIFSEIKRAKHSDSIRLLGSPSSEDRVFLYNASELFAYPSFFEGFGFQPLEAQACGVPVVSSNRTSLPEILGNTAELIDPWSVDELYNSIYRLLSDTEYKKEIISRGLINSSRFSWEAAAKKTLGLFHNLFS